MAKNPGLRCGILNDCRSKGASWEEPFTELLKCEGEGRLASIDPGEGACVGVANRLCPLAPFCATPKAWRKFSSSLILLLSSPSTGEKRPSPALVALAEFASPESPNRSAMSMSMASRSSSMGLSAELPARSVPALWSVSGRVRSMSTDLFERSEADEAEAIAIISSGGNSFGPTARADLGASVTGDAKPLWNIVEASSALNRRALEDKSSFNDGKAGRWREDIEIADGRRPGGTEEPGAGGEFVGVGKTVWIGSAVGTASETGGRGIRDEVGESEADFERVRLEIEAVSASFIRRSSRPRSL